MTTNKNNQKDVIADTAVDKAQQVAEKTQEKVSETASMAKEQAKRAASQVTEQAKSTVDTRMTDVAGELGSVANAVRQTSYEIGGENETVARYGERIAEQLEGISSYLNEKGVEDVLTDLQDFARRKPAVFLGGAFMLGMVVGRFLRSSGDRYGYEHEGSDRYGAYYDDSRDDSYAARSGYQGQNRYQSGLDQESTTFQGRS